MEDRHVIFTREQGIAIITMNRPERLNAMSTGMMDGMCEAVEVVKGDPDTYVLIITGAGRGFCSGMDVKGMAEPHKAVERGEAVASSGKRAIFWREGSTHKFCLSLMTLTCPQ